MKRALVIGIGGQDGRYATELLLAKGYAVTGAGRPGTDQPRHLAIAGRPIEIMPIDLCNAASIAAVIASARPDEIYNFAAFSSGAAMFDAPEAIGEVNGLAVVRILEAIRAVDPAIRFCQASSSELFGAATTSPQSETTPMVPRSPYGAATLYAHQMIGIYRRHFGLFACSAILYNHESPRRDQRFVTRKVTMAAARISLGLQQRLTIGNLDAVRDWGFAGDHVHAAWLMLQAGAADDYVVATGMGHSVRELCEASFAAAGLDYRGFIDNSTEAFRAPDTVPLIGDAAKARSSLGWSPTINFKGLVAMMVEADTAIARAELLNGNVR